MIINEFVRDRNLEPNVKSDIDTWANDNADKHRNPIDLNANADAVESLMMYFHERGWEVLGNGVNSVALDKPGSDFIIKVSVNNDKGFNRYVLLTHKANNPHFPKISNMRRINSHGIVFYIYLIEKLEPVEKTEFNDVLLKYLRWEADQMGWDYFDAHSHVWESDYEKEVLDYIGGHPKLIQAIHQISGNYINMKGQFRIDLHQNNFMQRKDGTIVITDPFIYEEE